MANGLGSEGVREVLLARGIRPSAHRIAVGQYVLSTAEHPSAEEVHRKVSATFPTLSRATVYNTLRVFQEANLLRELVIAPGHVVFDPKLEPHHHFVDEESGRIFDLPLSAFSVEQTFAASPFEFERVEVVARGRFRGGGSPGENNL